MFFHALAPISGGLTSCGGSSGGVVPITRPILAVAVYGATKVSLARTPLSSNL